MPTFTVIRDGSVIEDSVFDVDPVVDTSNPFGDFAVVKMDDRGGEKFDAYNRGTRVEITVDPDDATLTIASGETVTTDSGDTDEYNTVNNGGTYENQGTVTAGSASSQQFTGYCVEPRETEQSGADVLEVESYSLDQFLRRNTVTNDQTGNLISEALQDIIETDTPVSYNAAKVNVGDDQELTRSYRGEPVEAVFRDLAFKSNNEEFGVDGDLDAFFRPRETEHIDRGIDDTQWFNYDIPELGKEAVNEVEVWFDDGNESVIVDDGTDKLDLQESLDLPEPGTQRAELNRPLITDINDAEDIGRKYLTFRNSTLSGTVTTYGLFNADPGDTIDVTIEPRGIDTEFVIAATEYRWGRDETILTIVENRGEVDDILSEINDSVQRQEMQGADRDAPKNRITTTNATALIGVEFVTDIENFDVQTVDSGETLTVESGETETATTVENAGTVANAGTFETEDSGMTTAPADRFTNPGRRAVRDAWTGQTPPDIDTLVIGTDGGGLSRSNTTLRNETNSVSVSQTLPDATTVQFDASVTDDGIEEVGIETADGRLIARATFDGPVDLEGTVEVTLSVANDDSVSRGVLTTAGQTAVRDVLADNAPAIPTDYAYGSGDAPVAESDTALESEVVETSLEEVIISNRSSQADWEGATNPSDTDAYYVENGEVTTFQTAFTQESEAYDDESGTTFLDQGRFSNARAVVYSDLDAFTEHSFTTDYVIESGDFQLSIRTEDSTTDLTNLPAFEVFLDDVSLGNFVGQGTTSPYYFDLIGTELSDPGKIDTGDHTLRFEVSAGNPGETYIDVIVPHDSSYSYTFDNTTDANNALSGPELYPDVVAVPFAAVSTQRDLDAARSEQTWKDGNVSNEQYIELSNDGSNFIRTDNMETASASFAQSSTEVYVTVGISRYSSGGTNTPTDGDVPQAVQSEDLFANVQAVTPDDIGTTVARAIIPPNTAAAVGETFREAGMKGDGTLLTRHLLAEFDLLADQRLTSSESTTVTGGN